LVRELQSQWRIIDWIVCDGRRWIFKVFQWIPMQMCHKHQMEIVRRYIPKRTKIWANKELLDLVSMIPYIKKQTFIDWLDDRYNKYSVFINEKNQNKQFKHKKTRSAYNSLKYHKQRLYTYQDYKWVIDMPNTTNTIESEFSHLKGIVWVHRWLRKDRKQKVIECYLSTH